MCAPANALQKLFGPSARWRQPRMFREQLPRIYELRDLVPHPPPAGAYFRDLDVSPCRAGRQRMAASADALVLSVLSQAMRPPPPAQGASPEGPRLAGPREYRTV
jgi:hypothetical protein